MTVNAGPERVELPGGKIGVLLFQAKNQDWASAISAQTGDFVLSISTSARDIFVQARKEFLHLQTRCETIFVASFGEGAMAALSIAQEFGDEVSGLILIEPVITSDERALRKNYQQVSENLDLIEHPLLLMYSIGETGEEFSQAQEIAENVSSAYIREIVLNDQMTSTTVEETILFMKEVEFGFWPATNEVDDDTELIDAEFESIVAGLSLDQASPSNFLDNLDLPDPDEHFIEPNPALAPIHDRTKRNAIFAMIGGPIYALAAGVTGFNPLGVEPWPGVLAFFGGLALFLYSLRDDYTDEDGAIL